MGIGFLLFLSRKSGACAAPAAAEAAADSETGEYVFLGESK